MPSASVNKKTSHFFPIVKDELRHLSNNRLSMMLIVGLPLLLTILFGFIYLQQVASRLPMAVWDADHSQLSRTIVRAFESGRSMYVVNEANSIDEIREWMKKGKIQGAFAIPARMSADVKSGHPVTIVLYKNTSNLIVGNMILKEATSIVKTISAGITIQRNEGAGLTPSQAKSAANPIRVEDHPLYNPGYNYENYLVPGLLLMTLGWIAMIVASQRILHLRNNDDRREAFHTYSGRRSLAFGSALAVWFLFAAVTAGIVAILFPLFTIQLTGSLFIVLLFSWLYLLVAIAVGIGISSIVHDPMFATEVAVFINAPAFIFSGYTFPIEAMPTFLQAYAHILPSTYFLNGYLKLGAMGTPIRYAYPELFALVAFGVVAFAIARLGMRFFRLRGEV